MDRVRSATFSPKASGEVLSLDSRLLRTVRALLRPGLLTSEYLAGRRARYLSPVRVYLLGSVAFGAASAFADESFVMSLEGADPDRDTWVRLWLWLVLGMIPVFAGLVRLVVGRRGYFTEQLVFAMHVHAFGFLLAAVTLPLMELRVAPFLQLFFVLVVPPIDAVYVFVALRRVYALTALRAVLSTVVLGVGYLMALLLALTVSGLLVARFAG